MFYIDRDPSRIDLAVLLLDMGEAVTLTITIINPSKVTFMKIGPTNGSGWLRVQAIFDISHEIGR